MWLLAELGFRLGPWVVLVVARLSLFEAERIPDRWVLLTRSWSRRWLSTLSLCLLAVSSRRLVSSRRTLWDRSLARGPGVVLVLIRFLIWLGDAGAIRLRLLLVPDLCIVLAFRSEPTFRSKVLWLVRDCASRFVFRLGWLTADELLSLLGKLGRVLVAELGGETERFVEGRLTEELPPEVLLLGREIVLLLGRDIDW